MSNEFSICGIGEFSREFASDRIFERIIYQEYIAQVCDQLESNERDAVILNYFGAMSLDEIGSLFGRAKSSVKRDRDNGLKKLFFLLAEDRGLFDNPAKEIE